MSFENKPIENFIGVGLTFPVVLNNGAWEKVTGTDLIKTSILIILSWPYNHRFFLSEFGSKLDDLLEEPNDEVLKALVETYVIDAIERWEKRIEPLEVELEQTPDQIFIKLHYRIVNNQKVDSFIFPFYSQIIY